MQSASVALYVEVCEHIEMSLERTRCLEDVDNSSKLQLEGVFATKSSII